MPKAKAKLPTAAMPVKGIELAGNIARYAALLAHEINSSMRQEATFPRGTVEIDLTLVIDMNEARRLADATKAVVVRGVRQV